VTQIIRKLHLETEAKYLGNIKNAKDTLTPKIDVLVMASKSEGLPMSILEAQGLGIPVIATKVGGITEIIDDGINGLITSDEPKDIRDNILKLYRNPDFYKYMSGKSKSIFKKKFSLENMGDSYYDIYVKMLKYHK